MKCFNCNSEVADNNTFCPLCGTSLVQNNNSNVIESNINVEANPVAEPVNPVNVQASNVATGINTPVEQANSVSPMSNDINKVAQQNNVSMDVNLGMNQNNNFNVGVIEPKTMELKGKSKASIIIASVLIVIILAVAGVCGYLFMNSPKKMFVSVIDKSYGFLFNSIDSKMYTSDTVSLDFDLKTTNKILDEDMGPIFNIIKNISLSGMTQIDYKNKNLLINLDSKYGTNELVKAGLYVTNEKLYIDLNDLYDKKLSSDIDGINEMFKINEYSNDIFNIVEEVKNVVKNSLKEEYFVKEKVKMNVNGAEASVDKTILLLNYNNFKTLLTDCLNSLKSNEKFLNSFVNLMKLEEDEITKQDMIDEINDMLEGINGETEIPEGDIKIILYTKGFNKDFVGFAIENKMNEYSNNFSIINDRENIYTLKMYNEYNEITADILVNGNVYTLKIEEEGINLEFGLNLKTYDYNFKFIEDEEKMTASLTTDKDGKKHLSILYEMEGNEIGIDMNYTIKYNESVTIPTLTPSLDIESISEEDGKNILNKLQEKQGVKDLMSEIESLSSIMTPIVPVANKCAYAFGCNCGNNNATCTCQYINEDGNVASDTIECDNPNYQNCPSGVNCLQSDNYNTYNETLNNAKKSAMKVYADRVLSNATEEYVTDKLINNTTDPIYYDISTLMGTDSYFGCVKVSTVGDDYDYSLLLYDANNKLKIEGFADNSILSSNAVISDWLYSDIFNSYDYSSNTCNNGSLKQKLDEYNKYVTGVNKLS